ACTSTPRRQAHPRARIATHTNLSAPACDRLRCLQWTAAVAAATQHPNPQFLSSEDVEGAEVYNPSGKYIGEIDHLLLDEVPGRVAYAAISFCGFMCLGTAKTPCRGMHAHTTSRSAASGPTPMSSSSGMRPSSATTPERSRLGDPDTQALRCASVLVSGWRARASGNDSR